MGHPEPGASAVLGPAVLTSHAHIAAGRLTLAFVILWAWNLGAAVAGPHYFAEPMAVLQRLVESTRSGIMTQHVLATLRLSSIGFAGGCAAGLGLPLLLYPLPRLMVALEPYVVASAGVPKYALVPLLILWFGIDDAPKVWLIGLLVFYPVFLGVLTGTREVDRRLLIMARVVGAGSFGIARLVVWPSMMPFLFSALMIAVPRAVSGAIIGEFLIGHEGVGYLIESARQNVDTVGVFANIAVATALVLTASALIRHIERQVARGTRNTKCGPR